MVRFYAKISSAVMAVSSIGLVAAPAQATMFETTETSEAKKGATPKKIKDRRHPDYVRCRSQPVMGSLARKRRVCMTNKEWTIHIREGNKRATEFMDDIAGGMKVE